MKKQILTSHNYKVQSYKIVFGKEMMKSAMKNECKIEFRTSKLERENR